MAVGGTAPLICRWLLGVTGNPLAPAWFLVATAVVTAGTALTLVETRGAALRAVQEDHTCPMWMSTSSWSGRAAAA